MTLTEPEGLTAPAHAPNTPGKSRNSADIMLAPLRTIRKLHAIAAPPIARRRRDEFPLSSAQQKIWVFSQLNPEMPIFNTFRAYKITGPFRPDLLKRCLNEIAARHEILRTIYPEIDGVPSPVIVDNLDIPVEIIDSGDQLTGSTDDELIGYCNNRISQPIELTRGPVFRAEVVKIAEDAQLLIMVSHQIVFDGASWSNLNRELATLYESYCSDSAPPLKELPIQYFDFALWQSEFLQDEVLDQLSSYWKQQLGSNLPILGLPTQAGKPAMAYNEGYSLPFTVPGNLTEGLKVLGKREGVTLFVVILSAFNLLLRQFADQSDLIVFTSVPCRTRSEFRNLIGLFSNFIPMRSNLEDNPKFTELLVDVQMAYSGALAHQDMPFEYIMKDLQSGQSLVNESLFQTLFVFENATKRSLSFRQCELTPLNLQTGFTKFDITLFMEEKEGVMTGSLRYKPAKFSTAMIELMVSRFVTVLKAVVAQPEYRIDDIRCLSPSERSALLKNENNGAHGDLSDERKPAPGSRIFQKSSNRMPSTKMESLVSDVWGEVLGIDRIGIHDNFFDLGGNSMLLVILIGRLQKQLQRNISIVEIFRDPTVSSFVKRLGDEASGGSTYDHVHERAAKKRQAMLNRKKNRPR